MKTNLILTGIILFLFAIYSYSIYELGKRSVKCEPEIHTVDDYIDVADDSAQYKPKIIYKKVKVNVDSIYLAAKKYWEQIYDNAKPIDYVASIDTTYNDSLLTADISFVSRIPLDPEAYYKLKFNVRERTIYNTSIKEVYNKSRFFLGIGLRMPLTDEIESIYFARGGIYLFDGSWLEIPIGLQANYVNKLDWELNAEARVKF